MTRTLESRLARVERELARIDKQKQLAGCICRKDMRVILNAEELEEEISRSCPVHGVADLEQITCINFINPEDGTMMEESAKLNRRLKEYEDNLSPACDRLKG